MTCEKEILKVLKNGGCKSVNEFGEPVDLISEDITDILRHIPDTYCVQLKIFAESNGGDFKSVQDFMYKASQSGILNFRPFLSTNKDGLPVLVLKYNRYVQFFKGRSFWVSYTYDIVCDYHYYYASYSKVSSIMQLFQGVGLHNSKIQQCFVYMGLLETCATLDTFDKLLKLEPELVDEFISKSIKHYDPSYEFTLTYDELCKSVVRHKPINNLPTTAVVLRLPNSNTMDNARLIYSHEDNRIIVETMRNGVPQFIIFEFPLTMNDYRRVQLECEMDYVRAAHTVEVLIHKYPEILTQLATFALKYCGVILNRNCQYKKQHKDELLMVHNDKNEVIINNAKDLYTWFSNL